MLPESLAVRLGPTRSPTDAATVSDQALHGRRLADGFGKPEQWQFTWERSCTSDQWLDQVPTHGFYARLPLDKLQRLLTETRVTPIA